MNKSLLIFLREIAICAFAVCLYYIFLQIIMSGFSIPRITSFFLLIIIFYTFCFYLCYAITMKFLKSQFCFLIASWILFFIPPLFFLLSNSGGNLTLNHSGIEILKDGDVTLIGFLYLCLTPFSVLAGYATYNSVCYFLKNKMNSSGV